MPAETEKNTSGLLLMDIRIPEIIKPCIALLSLTLLASCNFNSPESAGDSSAEKAKKPLEVYTEKFTEREIFTPVRLAGKIQAKMKSPVYTPVSGIVDGIHVREGERVTRGQLLMTLRPDSNGFDFQLFRLKAPATGVLIRWDIKQHERAEIKDSLGVIADLSSFEATVYAARSDLPFLPRGATLDAEYADGLKGVPLPPAVVRKLVPETDDKTMAYPVRLDFQCKDSACDGILSGSLVEVTVKRNRRQAILVPSRYLHKRSGKVIIMESDGRCKWQEIKTGEVFGDETEILGGITADTKVVTMYSRRPSEGEILTEKTRESGEQKPDSGISASSASSDKGAEISDS